MVRAIYRKVALIYNTLKFVTIKKESIIWKWKMRERTRNEGKEGRAGLRRKGEELKYRDENRKYK